MGWQTALNPPQRHLMPSLLMFTDASPQEFTKHSGNRLWKTLAGFGLLLPTSPFASGLLLPRLGGFDRAFSIPNPQDIADLVDATAGRPFIQWKNIRGRDRKSDCAVRLMSECATGRFYFLSHSTRTDFEQSVADYSLRRLRLDGSVFDAINRGVTGYSVKVGPEEAIFVDADLIPSLIWMARALLIFCQKVSAGTRLEDATFLHDSLPFDRSDDSVAVTALAHNMGAGQIYFDCNSERYGLALADNVAGAMNAFVSGTDSTIQSWLLQHERPKSFCVTVDNPNGSATDFA